MKKQFTLLPKKSLLTLITLTILLFITSVLADPPVITMEEGTCYVKITFLEKLFSWFGF